MGEIIGMASEYGLEIKGIDNRRLKFNYVEFYKM